MIVPLLLLDYSLRKDYIIEAYCINKNRPELRCDGKCFLAQKIQESKEKEAKENFLQKVFSSDLSNHSISYYFNVPLLGYEFLHFPTFVYILKNYKTLLFDFFQPPIG